MIEAKNRGGLSNGLLEAALIAAARDESDFLRGTGFKRRNLKDIDNVDVAPTIAELLGMNPPKDSQGEKIRNGDK